MKHMLICLILGFFGLQCLASELAIESALRQAEVNYAKIHGFGFGIDDSGNSKLNRMAATLYKRFGVKLVLDPNPNRSYANYDLQVNAIFLGVSEENIHNLTEWKPSLVRSALIHEITHVYLIKDVDSKGRISLLSATLEGKSNDAAKRMTNPYHDFLSFQEYVTFTKQIKYLISSGSYEEALNHILTLDRFAQETLRALDYFSKDLSSASVNISESFNYHTEAKIRYLRLESPEWNLNLIVDSYFEIDSSTTTLLALRSRLSAMKELINQIRQQNLEIRKNLMARSLNPSVANRLADQLIRSANFGYRIRIKNNRCEKALLN